MNKTIFQIHEVIESLKAGESVAFICVNQERYDKFKALLANELKLRNEDPSLIDNFFCMMPKSHD